jgi:hypothetical protein
VTASAEAALVAGVLDHQRREVMTFLEAAETGPWADASSVGRSVRWLTPEQVFEVFERLRAVLDEYPESAPEGQATRPVSVTQTLFPLAP